MNCERCGLVIEEDDQYLFEEKTLCEDCYIGAIQPPRPCNVAAVYSATTHRKNLGQTGTEGLLDIQKQMYNYIHEKGRATKQDLVSYLNISEWELEKQFAILRHCELLKGTKIDGQVYMVPFNS